MANVVKADLRLYILRRDPNILKEIVTWYSCICQIAFEIFSFCSWYIVFQEKKKTPIILKLVTVQIASSAASGGMWSSSFLEPSSHHLYFLFHSSSSFIFLLDFSLLRFASFCLLLALANNSLPFTLLRLPFIPHFLPPRHQLPVRYLYLLISSPFCPFYLPPSPFSPPHPCPFPTSRLCRKNGRKKSWSKSFGRTNIFQAIFALDILYYDI